MKIEESEAIVAEKLMIIILQDSGAINKLETLQIDRECHGKIKNEILNHSVILDVSDDRMIEFCLEEKSEWERIFGGKGLEPLYDLIGEFFETIPNPKQAYQPSGE